jgi:hypothetical protein
MGGGEKVTFETYLIGSAKGADLDTELKRIFTTIYGQRGLPSSVSVAGSREGEVREAFGRLGLEAVEVHRLGGILSTELWVNIEKRSGEVHHE